jgi:hypothetical protein
MAICCRKAFSEYPDLTRYRRQMAEKYQNKQSLYPAYGADADAHIDNP